MSPRGRLAVAGVVVAVALLSAALAQNQTAGMASGARAPASGTLKPASAPAESEPAVSPSQSSLKKPEAASPSAASPATPAKQSAAPAPSEVAALILASQETTLASQMAGRLRLVGIGLGDEVKKGQRLMEFDCSEQAAQVEAAEAEYRGARETHLARLRLQALGAAGELEVTVAASASDKAKSQVEVRKAQLAYCSVHAPFSGNVARVRVKASESVNAGQPLVDLVNPEALKAQMFVPAGWVAWLRVGMPVTIHVRETGQSFHARVEKLNARVDGVSQQLEVEARIEKGQGRLLPGMVGSAAFEAAGRQ
jgi:membrane fusion protein (multidrug efflux system)